MIKTLTQLEKLADSDQTKAFYELHHLNNVYAKRGLRCEILKNPNVTKGILITFIESDKPEPSWYEVDNNITTQTFKNWSECYHYILGMNRTFKMIY